MKSVDMKFFSKKYNNSSDEEKEIMVMELFHKWVIDFEKSDKKSGHEIVGVIQSRSIWWKKLLPALKPFSDGCEFTEYSFCEFFYQQLERIDDGVNPKYKIDALIKKMGYEPDEIRAPKDYDREMIIPFGVRTVVKRGVLLNADVNQLLDKKPKFIGKVKYLGGM